MDANEALADLQQISVQVVHALVTDQAGGVEACTLPDAPSAERMARAASELWSTADRARSDLGRDSLSQLEVSTQSGSVFVVQDERRRVVATTAVDPTVGLVFYDLKTCLRQIAGDDAAPASPTAEGSGHREAKDGAPASRTGEGHGYREAARASEPPPREPGLDETGEAIPPHLEAGKTLDTDAPPPSEAAPVIEAVPDEVVQEAGAPAQRSGEDQPTDEHERPDAAPEKKDDAGARPFASDPTRTPLGDRLAGTDEEPADGPA